MSDPESKRSDPARDIWNYASQCVSEACEDNEELEGSSQRARSWSRWTRLGGILADLTAAEVVIPKGVRLHNNRLNKLYKILQLFVLVTSLFRLIVMKQWTSPKNDAYVSITLNGELASLRHRSSNALRQQSDEAASTPLCNRSTAPSEVSHGEISATCLPICTASTREGCVSPFELALFHSTPRNSLFVTGIVDTSISENDDIRQRFFLTPYEEDMELTIEYVVTLPASHSGLHGVNSDIVDATSGHQRLQLSSAQHLSTRLLAQDDSIAALFQPGEAMRLTLPEILSLAGKPDFLQKGAGSMPTGHLAGMEVEVRVDCMLNNQDPLNQVCDARLYSVPRVAADRTHLMPDRGLRSYHGIHVNARGACTYEVVDLDKLYGAFIAFLVFWRVPCQIISVFSRFLLGHTSKIYNRVIVENFHLRETMVGLILRLLIGRSCWLSIAGENGVIDGRELVDALEGVFGETIVNFDEHEIAAMATQCWKSLVSHQEDGKQISAHSFNAALIAQETVHLDDIIAIFHNSKRTRTVFEKVFQPELMLTGQMSRRIASAHIFRASSGWSEEAEEARERNDLMPDECVEVEPEHANDSMAQAQLDVDFEIKRADATERPVTPQPRDWRGGEAAPIEPTTGPPESPRSCPSCDTSDRLQPRLERAEGRLAEAQPSLSAWQELESRLVQVELKFGQSKQIEVCSKPDRDKDVRNTLLERQILRASQDCWVPVLADEGGESAASAKGRERSTTQRTAWLDDVNAVTSSSLEGRKHDQEEAGPFRNEILIRVAVLESEIHRMSADLWKLWVCVEGLQMPSQTSAERGTLIDGKL